MTKQVQARGILDSLSTMKDNTLKLVFRTQELPPDESGLLHALVHKEGVVAFAPDAIQDVKPMEGEVGTGKSSTQRLYNVLFVYWKQQGEQGDFDTWRRQYMERLIDSVKAKLD